ncbi:MAG: Calx-beta domain-containing protein, partial [Planctomycetota bacterium]
MCLKVRLSVLIIGLLLMPVGVQAAVLQCDAGTSALQAGWTQITAGSNIDVAGTGIDVTLATGNPAAIAHRGAAQTGGGSGPLAAVEEDLYFADNESSSPGSDFILTLSNLPAGSYLVKSYHNRFNEAATTIPAVTVTGATNVTAPSSIVQNHPIMDSPAEIFFTADGLTDVVIRYQGPAGGCPGCQAFFNGFELELAGPTVQFDAPASGNLESVSPAQLPVSLSEAQVDMITVSYAVTGGTADGADYTISPSPLIFSPGQTDKTIDITIVNDGEDEDNETIEVTLTGVTGGDVTLGATTLHTYTIIDPRPDVQFQAPTAIVREDAGSANVAVSLSHTWAQTVTVDYSVTGGTATNGDDYVLADGTLTFDPCQISRDIVITILDDPCEEGPENIELTLSDPNNAKLGDTIEHVLTVDDDELGATFVNTLGMKFVLIPPGAFEMGSDDGEWDERPVHKVTISQAFYVMESEVTADQYGNFDANYSGSDAATGMSWHDANDFARWLSELEGRSYRLATEAEWEYGCRAGTTTPYSSGAGPPAADTNNPWGIRNMHTSPREWVRDWHGEYSYEDQVDPVGPGQGLARVVRGGGLDEDTDYYRRSANRAGIGPGFGGGQHDIGIRLLMAELPSSSLKAYEAPAVRQGIKENALQVTQGPNPAVPYFNQRPLLPIPPDDASRDVIDAAGLHPSFRGHNHSPALEVCPNGDVLMIIYTSYSEYEPGVSLMATRLRFGALVWDMPTPMFDFPGVNDHAPMLWTDNGTVHFFWGCPRLDGAGPYPFQWLSSTDSGATWTEVKFPKFIGPIGGHSRQPINTALRVGNTLYVSSDGSGGQSVLWKSDNNGLTWYDPGGRTGGRHTTFVLLNNGDILGMGGKNTNISGYMPKSISSDGAQSWTVSSTPFNWLGGNQRPCIIRLASGRLFFCSDYQHSFDCDQAAGITEYGSLVALSDDEGLTWTIKKLTSALPHQCSCWDCGNVGTLGYSAARQAPNGIIHVISTMNHPCQHFEMNEAWILDPGAPPTPPTDPGETGTVNPYQADYAGGGTKATWSAKTCTDGRYLLHGTETWY